MCAFPHLGGLKFRPGKWSDLERPTYATRVWVADVNGDGKLDLIVGDSVTLLEPAKGLSEEQMKKTISDKDIDDKTKAKARAH